MHSLLLQSVFRLKDVNDIVSEITYNTLTDSVTYNEIEYARLIALSYSLAFNYVTVGFSEGESLVWTFDVYGNITLSGVVIGRASSYSDSGFIFTDNEGTEVSIVFSVESNVISFTYLTKTYSATRPMLFGYAFVDKMYMYGDNKEEFVMFSSDGSVKTSSESSTVTSVTQGENTITVIVQKMDETTETWVYDENNDQFTIGEKVFTIA